MTEVSLENIRLQAADHPIWSGPELPDDLYTAGIIAIKHYINNRHLLNQINSSLDSKSTKTVPKRVYLNADEYDSLVRDVEAIEVLWTTIPSLDRWIITMTWWATAHTGSISTTMTVLKNRYSINMTATDVKGLCAYWAGIVAKAEGWI